MRRKNTTKDMMKSYIIQALFELLKSKDYHDISILEISERAGVNRSTYYRNFSSKDEILQSFFKFLMDAYAEHYKIKKIFTVEEYLLSIFTCFYAYKEELLMLYKNDLIYPLLDIFRQYFAYEKMDETMSEFEKYKLAYHVGGIYNNLLFWFHRDMKETPREMVDISLRILQEGYQPNVHN